MKNVLRIVSLALCALVPIAANASAARLNAKDVEQAVGAYAKARGIRATKISARITGSSASGKSTLATITVGGKQAQVAINEATGRVQSHETGALVNGLLAAHEPMKRAETQPGSRFVTKILSSRRGAGALQGKFAPLGRPRAGQSRSAIALDAMSLGQKGSVTLALGTSITAGQRGAGLRVRENGLGSGTIINQTPGLVEVGSGSTWYRLGYAGYKTAGDALLLKNAIDHIPAGTVLSRARITDAPNAPHAFDPTDNAVASARGVRGFDLVSVEALK